MGAYYECFAGFGVKVDLQEIVLPTQTRDSCEHPQRLGQIFCPICGERVKTTTLRDDTLLMEVQDALNAIRKSLPRDYICERMGYDSIVYFLGWAKQVNVQYCEGVFVEHLPPRSEVSETVANLIGDLLKRPALKKVEHIFNLKTFGFYLQVSAS